MYFATFALQTTAATAPASASATETVPLLNREAIEQLRIREVGFSQDFHKLYTLGEKIGRGAEGEVFVGESRGSGEK